MYLFLLNVFEQVMLILLVSLIIFLWWNYLLADAFGLSEITYYQTALVYGLIRVILNNYDKQAVQ